ncbi:MAG: radical SAM protein [Candidatus Omnitrophica bacterium]|nr:radical SAM protein [Candidatus Omnitrophota bacterium]
MQEFDNTNLAQYADFLKKKYTLNRKLLLIQAPQFLFGSFNPQIAKNRGYYAYPPTGLQCIAKALKDRNLDIDILDLNYLLLKRVIEDGNFDYHNWLQILDEYLEKNSPSIVGVTSINIYADVFKPGYPLTSIMEHLINLGKYLVIAGGPIASNEYQNYLNKGLSHFIIEGEGENKINFLMDNLFGEKSKSPAVGGIYFKYKNEVEETKGVQDKVKLTGNIVETYDLIPIADYHKVGSLNPYSRMSGLEKPFSVFQLNRGCRANCKFCGVNAFMGKGVRTFPVSDVLDEITYLVKKKGIRHFDVLDDDFLVNKEAVKQLLQGLIDLRKDYKITWSSNNGLIALSINREMMELMRSSGCVGFRIGIESGSAEMLKKMRKPATLDSLRKAASVLNEFPEIFSGANYIIGLLGEEKFAEMLETLKFGCELNLDWASFAIFQFTSNTNINREKFKTSGWGASDFVPSKSETNRHIVSAKEKVASGPDVFNLPAESVPSYEQLKEIWFSFNLVANYINNKNLKEGGDPRKFVSWVDAVRVAYPNNPYMLIFSALGSSLLKELDSALKKLKSAKVILEVSEYWRYRFSQFELTSVVDNFPSEAKGAKQALAELRKRYSRWI